LNALIPLEPDSTVELKTPRVIVYNIDDNSPLQLLKVGYT